MTQILLLLETNKLVKYTTYIGEAVVYTPDIENEQSYATTEDIIGPNFIRKHNNSVTWLKKPSILGSIYNIRICV